MECTSIIASDEDDVSRHIISLVDEVLPKNNLAQAADVVLKVVSFLADKLGPNDKARLLRILVNSSNPNGLQQAVRLDCGNRGESMPVPLPPGLQAEKPNKAQKQALTTPLLRINDDTSPRRMSELQEIFGSCLSERRVVVKKNNRPSLNAFTEKERTKISNVIFSHLMGPDALTHVSELVSDYNKCM